MRIAIFVSMLSVGLAGYVLAAAPPKGPMWSCVGRQATGFALDPKTHRWTVARPQPRRYVIKPPERGPQAPLIGQDSIFVVVEVGDSDWSDTRFCKADFDAGGNLHCEGWGDDFFFNRQTGRFLRSFAHGYVEGPDNPFGAEGESPPWLEIGICTVMKRDPK